MSDAYNALDPHELIDRLVESGLTIEHKAMTSGLSTAISMCTNVHPEGSTAIGPVDHPAGGGGLLLRLRNGRYVVSACGIIRSCPQSWARLIAEGGKP